MTIPTHEEITLPILKFLSDNKEHSLKEILNHIIEHFNLSEKEKTKLVASGSRPLINNRVRWAKFYLKKGGLINAPRKGYLMITQKGIEMVNKNPQGIKIKSKVQPPESLKIKVPDEEKSIVKAEAMPKELEMDELEIMDKVETIPKEVEKKDISDLEKPDSTTNNLDKKELETLYKLHTIIENIEKKEIQALDKLNGIIKNIERKEIQTLAKLDNIIETIDKKEDQISVKLDNIIENAERKIIQNSSNLNNPPKELETPETKTLEKVENITNIENITNTVKEIEPPQPSQLNNTIESLARNENQTPDELMRIGYDSIKNNMGQELLEKLDKCTFHFFEKIILQLLTNMGYGKGEVINRTIDGRIDGFINPDRLGFDRIYFRAHRIKDNSPITTPMISDFVGSLDLNGVNKGVFITTSYFQMKFEQILQNINKIIILIDGNKLGELMVEYNIGVKTENVYEIKKIDTDFFLDKK